MYKLCKTQQSAARQRQLELGLLQAMLEQHYEEVSVSDLCDRMQIPRKSFYRYFSGKDGALHALIDHTLLEFQEVLANRSPPIVRPMHSWRNSSSFGYETRICWMLWHKVIFVAC